MKYYNYPNGTKTAEALDSENTSVVKGPDGKYIAPNELPAITANDKGKIVRVKADGSGIEYTGEAELPPITSADGGKVCKVKSDHSGVEWGEAGGGGGGNDDLFIVTVTAVNGDPVPDKTYEEIAEAIAQNKIVIVRKYAADLWPLMVYQYANAIGSGNTTKYLFYSFYIGNTTPTLTGFHFLIVDPTGQWSIIDEKQKNIVFEN